MKSNKPLPKLSHTVKALIVAVSAAIGGVISRFHGGGFIGGFPKVIKNALWAAPFATVVYFSVVPLWVVLGAFVLCLAGKATGHGGGMDLGTNPKEPNNGRSIERLEYLVYWLYPYLPRYWYDTLCMAIYGLAATSGAVFAMLYAGRTTEAVIMTLAGLAKAPAYMIGRRISVQYATEIGEFLTGVFAFVGLACVYLLIVS